MKLKKKPQRSCVGCGLKTEKNQLVRIVRMPDGTICLDRKGKLPGRGAYICPNKECLHQAIKRKALERALGTAVEDDMIVELSCSIADDDES